MDGGGGRGHELPALPTTSQEVEAAKKEEERLCGEAAEVKVWSISLSDVILCHVTNCTGSDWPKVM